MPLGDDSHRSRGAQGLPRTHTRGFTRKELACCDLSSEFLAPGESMVSNPAICGTRGTTRTILPAHLCASVPVPRQTSVRAPVVSRSLICSILLLRNEMAPLRALADVQALQARLRAAGLDDTLPSARPPSLALPPAKTSNRAGRARLCLQRPLWMPSPRE